MKVWPFASVLAMSAALATPAAAQDAASATPEGTVTQDAPAASQPGAGPQPAETAEQNTGDVGDIIVTAQKREQNLQDVPVVVSVLNQAQLEAAGVRDIKDLQNITPGLNVTSSTTPAQTSIRIRGVGTIGDNPGLESSVGTIVDGVYRARSGVAFGDLGELERVEVLKGPQSTLFGKNMSAGVINVVSARPSFDFSGEVAASYGNYDAWQVSGAVTGPIVDDVAAFRVFALKRERDGYWRVGTGAGPRTSRESDNADNWTVRGQLLLKPADGVDFRLIGDWSERDEDCCLDAPSTVGPTAAFIDLLAADAGIVRPANPFGRRTFANRPTNFKLKDRGISGELNWEIGEAFNLTSVSAYRYYRAQQPADLDFSSAAIWFRPESNQQRFKVFSQEIRLAYTSDWLNSIVGVFYADEKLRLVASTLFDTDYERYFGLLLSAGTNQQAVSALTGIPFGQNFVPGTGQLDTHFHRSKSFAVFTDNTITITDGLDLTLGLRYTDEEKNVTSIFTNTAPANACRAAIARPIPAAAKSAICAPTADSAFDNATTRQRRPEDRFSGSAKIQYRFSPEVMAYASYANGFKAGGFNLDRARFGLGTINPDTTFDTERVQSYEIGTKTTLFDRRVLANLAGFYQRYKGFQLNTFTGISFLVASIPKVTSKGFDFDLLWNTGIQGLSLNGGVGYADTTFGEFTPPPGINARLSGANLPYAAKWNVTGGFTSVQPVFDGFELSTSASVKYSTPYNTGSNLDPLKIQDNYAIVNARIGIGPESRVWSLEVYAQNLTNAQVYQVVVDQPLQSGTYGAFLAPPRVYGVTGRVRF